MKLVSTQTLVLIEQLVLRLHIGVPPTERRHTQPIVIDIACDLGELQIETDEMKASVNYADIAKRVREACVPQTFLLLEKLAETIAEVCLSDRRIVEVRVSCRKLNKLTDCAAVGVSRTFRRTE